MPRSLAIHDASNKLAIAQSHAMKLEWFLLLLFLFTVSILVLKALQPMGGRTLLILGGLWLAILLSAERWSSYQTDRVQQREKQFNLVPREGRPDGYVSSTKCRACHPNQYASWHKTFHRTMTQYPSPESVLGNFNNQRLELDGESFQLYRRNDSFYVEMVDPVWRENERINGRSDSGGVDRLARGPRCEMTVGLLTGSHAMQVYWLASGRGNMQMVFPFAWLIAERRWVPFHQTFLRDPSIERGTAIWNYTCIRCHSTGGQPRDNPEAGSYDSRAGELGIACEACHGPAERHVALNGGPIRRYQLHHSDKGDSSIVNPARLSSKRASEVCGQCHGIKWTPDPEELTGTGFKFRPGDELKKTTPIIQPSKLETQPWLEALVRDNPRFLRDRFWPDGEVRVSGREFNGLIDSACYQKGELSCLSCHSLHESNPDDQLAFTSEGNSACLPCHKQFAANIAEHTHHSAESTGSVCYNCHMPHTTYGLLKNIRSHRISSPRISAALQTGRSDACSLCHLDRTLEWTAQYLSLWYRQPIPALHPEQKTLSAAVRLALTGDAGQRALIAWHMGWLPAQNVSGRDWLTPYLAQLLLDPYAAVRYIAGQSLRSVPGCGDFQFDFTAGRASAENLRNSLLRQWSAGPGSHSDRPRPELLILGPGRLDLETINRLLAHRDDRSLDLQE